MMTQEDILQKIEEKRQQYIDAGLAIWDYAELPFEEYRSSAELINILKKEGFSITAGVAGLPTAFIAEWGQGGPVIGYMGEYDALPGLSQEADNTMRKPINENGAGHGCGHHILGTAAMAAAIANKDFLEKSRIEGRVRFYGCPAEEGGAGKVIMSCAGLFDDCDAAISWHATDDNGIWSINFHAQQRVEYTFRGKEPGNGEPGASSLNALQLFYTGAQLLRLHLDKCFIARSSILKTGDDDPAKTPTESKILYAYRAHTRKQIEKAMERLHEVAKGAAIATGCSLEANYRIGTSELLPNRTLERIMYEKYCKVGTVPMTSEDWTYTGKMHTALPDDCEGPTFDLMRLLYEEQAEAIIEKVKGKPYNNHLYPFREINIHKPGSTDICDVSWTTPTAQCVVACYIKDTLGHSWQEVSQGRSDICMKGMLVAAKIMALTGIELLEDKEALKAVRTEFESRRQACEYRPMTERKVIEDGGW
jgi:aminobenzoyl-glutamate utilization protein B